MKREELRKCIIKDGDPNNVLYFHEWITSTTPDIKKVSVMAILEDEDGNISTVGCNNIQFVTSNPNKKVVRQLNTSPYVYDAILIYVGDDGVRFRYDIDSELLFVKTRDIIDYNRAGMTFKTNCGEEIQQVHWQESIM